MSVEKNTYQEIAEVLPSQYFGGKMMLLMRPAYNDKGAYLWVYTGYDALGPSRVITLSGEKPPVDPYEFNDWIASLTFRETDYDSHNAYLASVGRPPVVLPKELLAYNPARGN